MGLFNRAPTPAPGSSRPSTNSNPNPNTHRRPLPPVPPPPGLPFPQLPKSNLTARLPMPVPKRPLALSQVQPPTVRPPGWDVPRLPSGTIPARSQTPAPKTATPKTPAPPPRSFTPAPKSKDAHVSSNNDPPPVGTVATTAGIRNRAMLLETLSNDESRLPVSARGKSIIRPRAPVSDPTSVVPPVPAIPAAYLKQTGYSAEEVTRFLISMTVWKAAAPLLQKAGVMIDVNNLWGNWPPEIEQPLDGSVLRAQYHIFSTNQTIHVYVKLVTRASAELRTLKRLFEPTMHGLERGVLPPIHGFIEPPEMDKWSFVLMPPLLPVKLEELTTIGDVLDFVRQLLEGVAFLHEKRISHGDIHLKNIMIVPPEYAPSTPESARLSTLRYTYCLIDYSYSHLFGAMEDPFVFDEQGSRSVPNEVLRHRKTNGALGFVPFPVDVWQVGRILKYDLIYSKANLRILTLLANCMGEKQPSDRCTASQALAEFNDILRSLKRADYQKSTRRALPPPGPVRQV